MREFVCVVCPNGCRIQCQASDRADGYTISGNRCKRGADYALAEMTRPMRTLTSSVKTAFLEAPVISVRTNGEIEKSLLFRALAALKPIVVTERVGIGDVIVSNVFGTGVDIICTSDRLREGHI